VLATEPLLCQNAGKVNKVLRVTPLTNNAVEVNALTACVATHKLGELIRRVLHPSTTRRFSCVGFSLPFLRFCLPCHWPLVKNVIQEPTEM